MILLETSKKVFQVRIKVMGVGGGGSNAVDKMIQSNIKNVSFCTVNTDLQFLSKSLAEEKIQIGEELTQGLGAGANPAIGREAAEESMDKIHEALEETDILILIAGMGGGTGTGAAPVIADAARQQGKMVIAFATSPFEFEGAQRTRNALAGIDDLKAHVHTMILIPNEKLYDLITEDTSLQDAFTNVDHLLKQAVGSLTRLILEPGLINLDFADVRSIMGIGGNSVLTFGEGTGVQRASKAVESALSNVLLDSKMLRGAKGLLVNVVGGKDMTLHEVTRTIRSLRTKVHEEANIIFGANVDSYMEDGISLTIIATGIDESSDDFQRFGVYKPLEKVDIASRMVEPQPTPSNTIKKKDDILAGLDEISINSFEDQMDIPAYIRKKRRFHSSGNDYI